MKVIYLGPLIRRFAPPSPVGRRMEVIYLGPLIRRFAPPSPVGRRMEVIYLRPLIRCFAPPSPVGRKDEGNLSQTPHPALRATFSRWEKDQAARTFSALPPFSFSIRRS